MLTLAHLLIALRRQTPELRTGNDMTVLAPEGVWAWRRGERVLVVLNMSDHESTMAGARSHIHIATDRDRDGEAFDGALTLRAWEAAITEIQRWPLRRSVSRSHGRPSQFVGSRSGSAGLKAIRPPQ